MFNGDDILGIIPTNQQFCLVSGEFLTDFYYLLGKKYDYCILKRVFWHNFPYY